VNAPVSTQALGDRMRIAVRNHAWRTKPDHWSEEEVRRHVTQCLYDLRQMARSDWEWALAYFEGAL